MATLSLVRLPSSHFCRVKAKLELEVFNQNTSQKVSQPYVLVVPGHDHQPQPSTIINYMYAPNGFLPQHSLNSNPFYQPEYLSYTTPGGSRKKKKDRDTLREFPGRRLTPFTSTPKSRGELDRHSPPPNITQNYCSAIT